MAKKIVLFRMNRSDENITILQRFVTFSIYPINKYCNAEFVSSLVGEMHFLCFVNYYNIIKCRRYNRVIVIRSIILYTTMDMNIV